MMKFVEDVLRFKEAGWLWGLLAALFLMGLRALPGYIKQRREDNERFENDYTRNNKWKQVNRYHYSPPVNPEKVYRILIACVVILVIAFIVILISRMS
jgi:hypothetical protein